MNLKLWLVTASLVLTAPVLAGPYQFEGRFGIGKGDVSGNGESVDFDTQIFSGAYFLRPVNTSLVPLVEAAFLDKAASVSITMTSTKIDQRPDVDQRFIGGRFVTSQNYILELDYDTIEADGAPGTDKTLIFGIGKYLDNRADVLLSYSTEDNSFADSEVDVLSIKTRRVNAGPGISTWWSYELGADYIDTANDDGYQLRLAASYYPSTRLAVGAEFELGSVGDNDSRNISLLGEYFFTEQFSATLLYAQDDADTRDIKNILFGVTGRF